MQWLVTNGAVDINSAENNVPRPIPDQSLAHFSDDDDDADFFSPRCSTVQTTRKCSWLLLRLSVSISPRPVFLLGIFALPRLRLPLSANPL